MANICFNFISDSPAIIKLLQYANPISSRIGCVRVSEMIHVNIENYWIEIDPAVLEIRSSIPRAGNLNIFKDPWFITDYFFGKVFLYTNIREGYTKGYICEKIEDENRTLRYAGWLRYHLLRHLIYHELLVLHAAGLVRNDEALVLVAGKCKSGKSTFVIDALKSGRYKVISDDRIVYKRMEEIIIGNPATIRSLSRYDNGIVPFFDGISAINGSQTPKYSIVLHSSLTAAHYLIQDMSRLLILFLNNREYNTDEVVTLSQDQISECLLETQADIYHFSERTKLNELCKEFKKSHGVLIRRSESGRNFNIFKEYDV